jgi:hypothetical protein
MSSEFESMLKDQNKLLRGYIIIVTKFGKQFEI